MSVKFEKDLSKLYALKKSLPKDADRVVASAAEKIYEDIDQSYSAKSPSSPGQPPAIVTGRLKKSVKFARVKLATFEVTASAPYAKFLEFGTSRMAARPFFRPALRRASRWLGPWIKARLIR